MERRLYSKLAEWKGNKNRKPLVLEGARQVGKTYLIKEFGKKEYDFVAYFNFQDSRYDDIKNIFDTTINPNEIITAAELFYQTKIDPNKTLIFFDEVQESPKALTSLKYFNENKPEYNVIVAGSLLGVTLTTGISYPVGQVDSLRLEPLDFEEFLWAYEEKELLNHLKTQDSPSLLGKKLKKYFDEYILTGGMPEVVSHWVEHRDIKQVDYLQNSILNAYRSDIGKHTKDNMTIRILQILDSLPAQFAKKNDKFVYGVIRDGARAKEYELAIEWLVDVGIVRRVRQVTSGGKIPLRAYIDTSIFKLYFLDVGLLRNLCQIPSSVVLAKNNIFDEFNGLLSEQYVLQQLHNHEPFYWSQYSRSEVDFVVQIDMNILPIEVKSGENVKSKSLQVYRDKFNPKIAVRFSLKGFEYNGGLVNIPLYYSFLFDELIKRYLS